MAHCKTSRKSLMGKRRNSRIKVNAVKIELFVFKYSHMKMVVVLMMMMKLPILVCAEKKLEN